MRGGSEPDHQVNATPPHPGASKVPPAPLSFLELQTPGKKNCQSQASQA